jgi:DNA-binding LacI/PurR family transcriptional regulator
MPDKVVDTRSMIANRSRPPTMKDVASAAGVSKALVSMIFRDVPGPNPSTKERVLETADRIGYRRNRTASLLARRRTKHLGVAMILGNAFHAELAEDVQAAANEHGYEIVLSTITRTHDERRAIETLLEFRCEALLLFGPELTSREIAALAAQRPVVVIGRRMSHAMIDVVRASDTVGIRQAVDHLVALGHRRIAYATAGDSSISTYRRRGYENAMRAHQLAAHVHVVPGGSTESAGATAAEVMLGVAVPPTAVIAFNDHCAVGVMDTLRRGGIAVPEAMSVIGYDDSPVARLAAIDLTTVSQEPRQQATLAVQAAVERLDGLRARRRAAVVRPRLVVRGSTAVPPIVS